MRYIILIYDNEASAPQDEGEMKRWFDYTDELRASGHYLAGEALHPTSAATTVRLKNGKRVVTDGPFAETKEQLGGFYMVECDNLDQALAWAEKIPSADRGSVEVRPIMDFGEQ